MYNRMEIPESHTVQVQDVASSAIVWRFILICSVVPGSLFVSCFCLLQLALKHRQGKNHKMRIIAFVGSPVEDNEKDVSLESVYWYTKS